MHTSLRCCCSGVHEPAMYDNIEQHSLCHTVVSLSGLTKFRLQLRKGGRPAGWHTDIRTCEVAVNPVLPDKAMTGLKNCT